MTELFRSYWAGTGQYQEDHDRLFRRLVPDSGSCETLQGECLRAAARIYYDYHNNGWGCNNWSGALEFLREYSRISAKDYEFLARYSRGQPYTPVYTSEDEAYQLLERVVDTVLEEILRVEKKHMDYEPSPCDMFDLEQKRYVPTYEDEEE